MGRTLRITLDKISEFSRTGYFVFGVGALALLFHVFAWDLFGILLFATLICLSLVFVEEYRAWLTLFANILFIVSTQKSPGYGDGSNYYTRPDILYPLIAAVCLMAACMVYRTVKDRKNLKDGKLFIPMGVLCLALLLAGVGQKYYLYSLKATFLMSAALIGVYCVFTATIKREENSWEYFSTLFAEICLLIAIEVAYVYFLNMINDGSFDGSHDGRWKDRIIAIRIARMANYETNWERPTIYIRQDKPLPAPVAEITGITDKMLAGGVSMEEVLEELDSLPCKDTPFLFTNEDFATGFLNAEYLRCGKTFDRPYVAIDKLANIPFGYLMQRKAWNIPALVGFKTLRKQPLDEELQKLFALTACTFEALQTRCDVRCPEGFAKLYAAELCE